MNTRRTSRPAVLITGIVLFIVLLLIDRASKAWAVSALAGAGEQQLIGDLFVLRYLENQGAAFGILQGRQSAFLLIAVIVLIVIVYLYIRLPYRRRFLSLRVLMVFIAAGAIGNLIDRIQNGYVVDFLYIKVIDFPIFNVADIYVTCCCILLIILLIFVYKDADFQEMAQAIRPGKHTPDSDGNGGEDA